MVVDSGNNVIGLYFAGSSDGYGVATPIAEVLSALNISMCSPIVKVKEIKEFKELKEPIKERKELIKERKEFLKERIKTWHGIDGNLYGLNDFDKFIRNYHATILSVDDSVGRLLESSR